MFVMPRYDTLVYCDKDQPAWTQAPLIRRQPGFPNENARSNQSWAAWVNDHDEGIGIWFPGTGDATTYRVMDAGVGNVSYIAPVRRFSLKSGLVFECEITLALGAVEQTRKVFTTLNAHAKQ